MRVSGVRNIVIGLFPLSALVACGASPPPDPSSPAATASPVEALSSAEQACEAAQRAGVPVRCRMGVLDDVPAVFMEFASVADANQAMAVMTRRVGKPFCYEAGGTEVHANALLVAGGAYRSFDCKEVAWRDWARSRDATPEEGGSLAAAKVDGG
jgi:hypothetical protein